MPGSTSSRRRSSPRRDRGRKDRPRDEDRGRPNRESSREPSDRRDSAELVPYEPRGRDGRPAAPRRCSTHNGGGPGGGPDEDMHDYRRSRDDQKYYPPRASDTRKRGGPPSSQQEKQRRPRSESRGRSKDHNGRARSGSRAVGDTKEPKKHGNNPDEEQRRKRNQAIQAALMAGALEAMRQRSEPGDWIGEKGFRVATAAVSAGLVDVGLDKDPNKHGVGNLIKSTVGGLLIDKVANSARK